MPDVFRQIIEEQVKVFNEGVSITDQSKIPDTTRIPIENPKHWLKIPDVICIFVDMKGSTQFSASSHSKTTARAYQLFTGTAVKIFDEFESPYIDVRGDGVLALFNSDQSYRAIAAVITFKTFAREVFEKKIKDIGEYTVGAHIGIDKNTILVRKIGLKRVEGRSDRQNEVWAGRPVNMAAKLAALGEINELWVSDRFYKNINNDLVRKSCGCPDGKKVDLWDEADLTDDERFDFDKAYILKSVWCSKHGKEYCQEILKLD